MSTVLRMTGIPLEVVATTRDEALPMETQETTEAMMRAGDLYRYVGAKTHEHKAIPN